MLKNISKSFRSFFIEAMELFLTIPNRINFLQMGRFGRSSEQRFSMNFRKKFDWISFNRTLVQEGNPNQLSNCLVAKLSSCTVTASNSRDRATASQGMSMPWTLHSICHSPQSTLPDSLERTMAWICPLATSSCSYTMLQWLNEYFQRSGKART